PVTGAVVTVVLLADAPAMLGVNLQAVVAAAALEVTEYWMLAQLELGSALTTCRVWAVLSWLNVIDGAVVLLFLLRLLTRTKTTAARTTVIATIRMTPMTGETASSFALKA